MSNPSKTARDNAEKVAAFAAADAIEARRRADDATAACRSAYIAYNEALTTYSNLKAIAKTAKIVAHHAGLRSSAANKHAGWGRRE